MFLAPGQRIRLGNITERTSAEEVKTMGSRTTKVGNKVKSPVISKPVSVHNRGKYEQRYCLPYPFSAKKI